MAETFFGTWLIDVIGKDAAYSQRYVISGSDRVDGAYAADLTTSRLQVSGAQWTLQMEWNDNVGSGWQASRTQRLNTTFKVDEGLVVVLGVDDNWIQVADNDFNDVVLRFQNIDPHLIPWHPYRPRVDFSLLKRDGDNHRPPKDQPDRPPKDQPDKRQVRALSGPETETLDM